MADTTATTGSVADEMQGYADRRRDWRQKATKLGIPQPLVERAVAMLRLTPAERVNVATVSAYECGLADGRREMAAEVIARIDADVALIEMLAAGDYEIRYFRNSLSGMAARIRAALSPQPTGGE